MDKENLLNIIDHDPQAYASLYTEYFKKLYNYGRKFTTDVSLIEDAIQEVFLDLWHKREKALKIGSLNAYLLCAFRYILFKKIKISRKTFLHNDFEPEPEFSIDHAITMKETSEELHQKLQAALHQLTAHQREAIFLRFYEGLSYEEIASILKISVKSTYKIMARSLLSLKENMPLSVAVWLMIARGFVA